MRSAQVRKAVIVPLLRQRAMSAHEWPKAPSRSGETQHRRRQSAQHAGSCRWYQAPSPAEPRFLRARLGRERLLGAREPGEEAHRRHGLTGERLRRQVDAKSHGPAHASLSCSWKRCTPSNIRCSLRRVGLVVCPLFAVNVGGRFARRQAFEAASGVRVRYSAESLPPLCRAECLYRRCASEAPLATIHRPDRRRCWTVPVSSASDLALHRRSASVCSWR